MKHHQYEIRVEGHLRGDWSDFFEWLTISQDPAIEGKPACTILSGPMDQAALLGVLDRLGSLALILISVQRVHTGEQVSQGIAGQV